MGSDAHIWCDVGRMDEAQKVIEEISFPNEKILNYTPNSVLKYYDMLTLR